MTEVLSSAQMRAREQAAIASGGVTGLTLMERAGRGAVASVFAQCPALARGAHQAVVLCGPGNNGGDGFVVARLLKNAGWAVTVYAHGWDMLWNEDEVRPTAPPDARTNAKRWRDMGGQSAPLDALACSVFCPPGRILVVDALLGIGQSRSADDLLRPWHRVWDQICDTAPGNQIYRVSVDVPTGYDSDTGATLGDHPFKADLAVTFHTCKPVHPVLSDQGMRVAVVDIGLSENGNPASEA